MSLSWLNHLIVKSAMELELARKTIFQFGQTVTQAMAKNPVQDWEATAWTRGLKTGLIRLEGYFFRVGSGKRSPLSFFIRNDQDLYVGLRRESITQAATYVSLVTDYGYSRTETRFESGWMDVVVFDQEGNALIYVENKANEKTLKNLCQRLSEDFKMEIPSIDPGRKNDDAVMKAQHIWVNQPRYFWGICPNSRLCFEVRYLHPQGFRLEPVSEIPAAQEWMYDS